MNNKNTLTYYIIYNNIIIQQSKSLKLSIYIKLYEFVQTNVQTPSQKNCTEYKYGSSQDRKTI